MQVHPPRSLRSLLLTHEVAFMLLVVITGAVGGTWGWQWQQWSAESIRLNRLSHTGQEIRSHLFKQIQEVSIAGLRADPAVRSIHSSYTGDIQEMFNELRRQSTSRAEDYAVQAMQTAYSLLHTNLREMLGDSFELNRLVRSKLLDPAFEQRFVADFERAFVNFIGLIGQQLDAQERAIQRWTEMAPYALAVPVLIGFALLGFARRSLHQGFVLPMREVIAGTREVSSGNVQHVVAAAGVAEIQEIANGINLMAQELEAGRDAIVTAERQAALGALVPVVAHNIRNPLAAIRANAQLLDGSEGTAERDEIRQDILDTVDRLERWVSALVSYLHPLQPRRRVVEATTVMASALHMLGSRMADNGLRCERMPWDEQARVEADPDLLEQALYGLLNNAVEASTSGSTIVVGVTRQGGSVRFSIRDEGGGIRFKPEPSDLAPGPSTKRFGTGLGIPVAYKICQTHGYRLEFSVREGEGTEAVITATAIEEGRPGDADQPG
ncbi:MAG: HAMP domain-containing sensor histidine kinase [Gammaproteobacteria bacterium]